jgi:hypothetical protein
LFVAVLLEPEVVEPPAEVGVAALVAVVVAPPDVADPLSSSSPPPPQAAINTAGMNGPKNLRTFIDDSFAIEEVRVRASSARRAGAAVTETDRFGRTARCQVSGCLVSN